MKHQKSRILLEKINALHKSMRPDNGPVSPIEKDLMLSYLRQLYDLFLDADTSAEAGSPSARAEATPQSPPRPEPLKRTYTPPRIIEIPDSVKELSTDTDAPPPAKEPVKPEPKPPVAPPQPEPEVSRPAAKKKSTPSKPELEALFEQKKATELSEKLSESPVHDLTRALAINDRLLYMNELFGRDMLALDESLKNLNKFQNMEEAKAFLMELAGRYDWTDEEKAPTAKTFIKLVRRRYTS